MSTSTQALLEETPFKTYPPWVVAKLRPNAIELIRKVYTWVETECVPAEPIVKAQLAQGANRWTTPPLIHALRKKAKAAGLFNIFLPASFGALSPGLTNLEYACCAEIMGRVYWSAQTMNCHAPETGNMELLAKYCSEEQKAKWLQPLMEGEASSAYSMTEPDKASSDATNVSCRITHDKMTDEYVINGRKLYGNVLWNHEVKFHILMGLSDPDNTNPWRRHTMIIVPRDTPGHTQVRNLSIMGYDHAPEGHGEYLYENARVPAANVILGEGRAFEIAQGRLGPGRIHHCMRLIGQAERAYELALLRSIDERKRPRGKLLSQFDSNIERIAQMRMEIDSMRLIVMNAADTMDIRGNKAGRYVIAQSKIMVPETLAKIIDECMQMYGGQGLTQHTVLPELWTYARFVRIADGPDAAHRHQVGRDQIKAARQEDLIGKYEAYRDRSRALRKLWKIEGLDTEFEFEYIPPAPGSSKL